jgi:hypothetical protein
MVRSGAANVAGRVWRRREGQRADTEGWGHLPVDDLDARQQLAAERWAPRQ